MIEVDTTFFWQMLNSIVARFFCGSNPFLFRLFRTRTYPVLFLTSELK